MIFQQHIGRQLYDYVVAFAKEQGYYNLTLNVWNCNESAMKFYESCGLTPQKVGMETILSSIISAAIARMLPHLLRLH